LRMTEEKREWEYKKTKGTIGIVGLIAIFIISFFDI